METKTSAEHAKALANLLHKTANLIESDLDGVEWKMLQKIARYMWQGVIIGRMMHYKETRKK